MNLGRRCRDLKRLVVRRGRGEVVAGHMGTLILLLRSVVALEWLVGYPKARVLAGHDTY